MTLDITNTESNMNIPNNNQKNDDFIEMNIYNATENKDNYNNDVKEFPDNTRNNNNVFFDNTRTNMAPNINLNLNSPGIIKNGNFIGNNNYIYTNAVQVNNDNNNNIITRPTIIEKTRAVKSPCCLINYFKRKEGKPLNCEDICIVIFLCSVIPFAGIIFAIIYCVYRKPSC